MKYSREEYNNKLLAEIEKGRLSFELKRLFYNLTLDNINSKRYQDIPEGEKDIYIIRGYEMCALFWDKYKIENDKKQEPFSYFSVVIRSAVADALVKMKKYGETINL